MISGGEYPVLGKELSKLWFYWCKRLGKDGSGGWVGSRGAEHSVVERTRRYQLKTAREEGHGRKTRTHVEGVEGGSVSQEIRKATGEK